MVIGTMKDLKEHTELMRKYPDMEHDAPHMVHVSACLHKIKLTADKVNSAWLEPAK